MKKYTNMLSMIVHTDCSYSARIAIKLHSNPEIYIVEREKKQKWQETMPKGWSVALWSVACNDNNDNNKTGSSVI